MNGQMVENMMVNTKMILKMALVHTFGLTGVDTQANG